jgi:hypothetical protein
MRRLLAAVLIACAPRSTSIAIPVSGTIDTRAPLTQPTRPEEDWDSDHDGLADNFDLCPNEAEDMDGFEDEDGCPDLDNDKDGIKDADDKCPNEPETYNGYEDDDGCPDRSHVIIH